MAFYKNCRKWRQSLIKSDWGRREKIKSDVRHSINYLDPCGALILRTKLFLQNKYARINLYVLTKVAIFRGLFMSEHSAPRIRNTNSRILLRVKLPLVKMYMYLHFRTWRHMKAWPIMRCHRFRAFSLSGIFGKVSCQGVSLEIPSVVPAIY